MYSWSRWLVLAAEGILIPIFSTIKEAAEWAKAVEIARSVVSKIFYQECSRKNISGPCRVNLFYREGRKM